MGTKISKVGRPPVDTELIRARLPRADIQGIDAFAAGEPGAPARPEALRRIVRRWLVDHGYMPAPPDSEE